MPRSLPWRVIRTAIAALLCALALTGCTTWQGPRIDPTGEQLILWPGDPTPAVTVPPPGVPIVAAPTVAPGVPPLTVPASPAPVAPIAPVAPAPIAPLPFGNVTAPPVYSDPTPPYVEPAAVIPTAPAIPGTAAPSFPAAPAVPGTFAPLPAANVAPAGPVYVPGPIAPITTTAGYGREALRVSPDRLVVPVGTEIVLKAGVFGADCQLVPHERIEWSIARTGVGQFTEMGIRDRSQLLGFWEAPRKVDEWCAIGRTAFVPVSLNAGTPNPADDVQIFRGESWVTMTSMCEGTSVVTAFAPNLCEFNQGTSTIFWIDAQWVFPASVTVPCGRPHTLTTTVARRTDGAPLAGWIVRYTVGGGASLGYEGGNTVDVPTDATGRASVEVSPMESGGGATNVGVVIVRPASGGPSALPRMEIGRGAAAIAWTAAAPAMPEAGAPVPNMGPAVGPPPATFNVPPSNAMPPSLPPTQPITQPPTVPPTNTTQPSPYSVPPTNTTQPSPYSPPPAASQSTGQPRLDISLRMVSAEQVAVGENVGWILTITNAGDAPARNIQVKDDFDKGLAHEKAPNQNTIRYNQPIRDLAPGESTTLPLDFKVTEAGQHCHTVTVTADDAVATQRACATGVAGAVSVKITGERLKTVGEITDFSVVVRNTGASPAANVELAVEFDPPLEGVVEDRWQRMPNGGLVTRLDQSLAPSEMRILRVHARCKSPANNACAKVTATAMGGTSSFDQDCHLEIRAALPAAGPGGPGLP